MFENQFSKCTESFNCTALFVVIKKKCHSRSKLSRINAVNKTSSKTGLANHNPVLIINV